MMAYCDLATDNLFETTAPSWTFENSTDPEAIRQKMISRSPSERRAYTLKVPVGVDSFRIANKFITNLIENSSSGTPPGGLWLLGDGGVGKTYVLEHVLNRYEPFEDELTRHCPVLFLSFDGHPSESSVLLNLLIQLGQDPSILSGKPNPELRAILLDALPACGTKAILFDEAHHLWLHTRAKRIKDRMGGKLGDSLKRLYDQSKVAFIFAGTPGLDDLINHDLQASTRWSGRYKIETFQYDDNFIGLLNAMDAALPMQEHAGLGTELLSKQIHSATGGNFRLVKRLLGEAVYVAATRGDKRLTNEHLADAYFYIFCREDNPFKK